ncbi:MAG: cupredoxin domain-containing protein [Gemmatimonadaceae bacterium]|nr:cupredoxin domain-containing protein [Gemmatimonadaceae bacterium]
MRFLGFAVVTGAAIVLGACGGGEKAATDTAAAAGASAAAAPAAEAPAAAPAAGAMAPITGTTHEIKMIGDGTGYKFEPAELTIKAGDGVKFVMVTGGPHNVAFDPAAVPAAAKAQLSANMPEQSGELSGKMLLNANETYTISFAGIPAGTYDFHCTPHLAMNMKGKITVQ